MTLLSLSLPQGYEAIFVYGNLVEALIWFGFSLRYGLKAQRQHPRQSARQQRCCQWLSGDFFLFGVSDLVEIYIQAWWRPWWLLVWKASCILGFVWFGWQWQRHREQ